MTDLTEIAQALGKAAQGKGVRITTAESCTGGLVAATITSVAGSSAWFDRAFVTYCNEAKIDMLGVEASVIEAKGVVSEEVARAMAQGALKNSNATLAVAITGIAGPTGAEPGKPVGTVSFGFAFKVNDTVCAESSTQHFEGDRNTVRFEATKFALVTLLAILS